MHPSFRRLAIAAGAATALVLGAAGTASAHVTINSLGDASQGGFAKIAFSVPNERDDASTVKLEIQIPKDHPLAFVSPQPKPGWEITTTTRKLDTPIESEGASIDTVIDTVTFTATGDTKIGPGQFDQFWLSVGPLPTDVDQLGFPALQTYDSKEVVSWIEPTPASGEEPEHPLPTLGLVAGGDDMHHGGSSSSSSSSDSSKTLSIIALVVGGLGLVVGGAAFAGSRRKPAA